MFFWLHLKWDKVFIASDHRNISVRNFSHVTCECHETNWSFLRKMAHPFQNFLSISSVCSCYACWSGWRYVKIWARFVIYLALFQISEFAILQSFSSDDFKNSFVVRKWRIAAVKKSKDSHCIEGVFTEISQFELNWVQGFTGIARVQASKLQRFVSNTMASKIYKKKQRSVAIHMSGPLF